MSGELLLINPRKRRSNPKRRRRNPNGRSPAQQAATRRMLAANRARRSTNPRRRRRRNPVPVIRRTVMATNPRRRIRRQRNPIALSTRGVMNLIQQGVTGAGGALAVDLVMGYVPFPANLKSRAAAGGGPNYLYYLTKTGLALALGTFGKRLLGKWAEGMAVGAMTVNAYDLMRTLMPAGVSLGYMNPARMAGLGRYVSGTGRYVSQNQVATAVAPAMMGPGTRRFAAPVMSRMMAPRGTGIAISSERARYVR